MSLGKGRRPMKGHAIKQSTTMGNESFIILRNPRKWYRACIRSYSTGRVAYSCKSLIQSCPRETVQPLALLASSIRRQRGLRAPEKILQAKRCRGWQLEIRLAGTEIRRAQGCGWSTTSRMCYRKQHASREPVFSQDKEQERPFYKEGVSEGANLLQNGHEIKIIASILYLSVQILSTPNNAQLYSNFPPVIPLCS